MKGECVLNRKTAWSIVLLLTWRASQQRVQTDVQQFVFWLIFREHDVAQCRILRERTAPCRAAPERVERILSPSKASFARNWNCNDAPPRFRVDEVQCVDVRHSLFPPPPRCPVESPFRRRPRRFIRRRAVCPPVWFPMPQNNVCNWKTPADKVERRREKFSSTLLFDLGERQSLVSMLYWESSARSTPSKKVNVKSWELCSDPLPSSGRTTAVEVEHRLPEGNPALRKFTLTFDRRIYRLWVTGGIYQENGSRPDENE